MRKFSLLATTAVAVAALSTTTAAQGRGAGKAPTAKAPNVGTSAPRPAVHRLTDHRAARPEHGSWRHDEDKRHVAWRVTRHVEETGNDHGIDVHGHVQWHEHGTTASTGTTTTPPPTFEPNAISTKISKNPSQLAKVKAMLPTGMTIEEASAGFRNQGQFIAALNASKNQDSTSFSSKTR